MRRIGVMGGTFDPIHHGHLVAASEVAHIFALDEVVFVPTGQPYQKDYREVSPAEDRYLMTVIATASNPRFSVSRVDIDRPGPTYTIDTLRDLRAAAGPRDELFFITGADALAKMLTWHDVDELFGLAHFVGCTRPGHRLSGAGLPEGKVSLVEIPALAISSTGCRARVEADEPIWYLVPDGVVQYIAKRGLYAKGRNNLPADDVAPLMAAVSAAHHGGTEGPQHDERTTQPRPMLRVRYLALPRMRLPVAARGAQASLKGANRPPESAGAALNPCAHVTLAGRT